jgi:hypothetical protein
MNVRPLGVDKQFRERGSVENAPVELDTMVSVLPRTHYQTHTTEIKLMRRMNYRTPYIYETIRPAAVHERAEQLIQQPLYIQHGITDTKLFIPAFKSFRKCCSP